MIDYKKAKKILFKSKIKIENEKINCLKSLNRVCASNIYSSVNYPSGNNAAFDGFAVNSKETIKLNKRNIQKFEIIKTIAAGTNPKIYKLKKFQTIEIMTGAIIPKHFDTIIPIEKINFFQNGSKKKFIVINCKIKKHQHVRFAGSDYKKRDLVIKKGAIIKSSHILAFRTLGIKKIDVKKKPNILFFSTGNEITKNKIINDWQIRDSNRYYIKSISDNFLFNFKDGGILRDKDAKKFQNIISKKISSSTDIIITSGAVSAGKYDFIPSVISKFKLSNSFKGVGIRPGKPIVFAKIYKKNKSIFGLPGNPISSAACFRFFVYPYLLSILGAGKEKTIKARLKHNFIKKKNITRFLKVKLTSTNDGKSEIAILKGQESFKIKSFSASNAWGVFNAGQSIFKKKELIECYLLNNSNLDFF
jgi:molybdopterin molybdotransferase